jgi:hypothetical protein
MVITPYFLPTQHEKKNIQTLVYAYHHDLSKGTILFAAKRERKKRNAEREI